MKNKKPLDPDDQIKRLGKRLKELRIKAGFTSAETFANEHGFSRALYARLEQGKGLQFTTLVRLVNCHQMSLSEFFSEGF